MGGMSHASGAGVRKKEGCIQPFPIRDDRASFLRMTLMDVCCGPPDLAS